MLKNGREIVVERFWERGGQIFYELNGSTFGFPRGPARACRGRRSRDGGRSSRDDQPVPQRHSEREHRGCARRIRDGDYRRAVRLYRRAIGKAPDAIEIRVELADLYLRYGDFQRARGELESARAVAPAHTGVRERLGDVYYGLGQTGMAIREWQIALPERSSPGLLYKMKRALEENDDDIFFDAPDAARFVIRYEGAVNATIGGLVAAALEAEFQSLVSEFRFTPSGSIEVTLSADRQFDDVSEPPSWPLGSTTDVSASHRRRDGDDAATSTRGAARARAQLHQRTHARELSAGSTKGWRNTSRGPIGSIPTRGCAPLRKRPASFRFGARGRAHRPLEGRGAPGLLQALAAIEYLVARRGRGGPLRDPAAARGERHDERSSAHGGGASTIESSRPPGRRILPASAPTNAELP